MSMMAIAASIPVAFQGRPRIGSVSGDKARLESECLQRAPDARAEEQIPIEDKARVRSSTLIRSSAIRAPRLEVIGSADLRQRPNATAMRQVTPLMINRWYDPYVAIPHAGLGSDRFRSRPIVAKTRGGNATGRRLQVDYMTRTERVQAAVHGAEVDRLPVCFWHHFQPDGSGRAMAEATLRFFDEEFDLDIAKVMPDIPYPFPKNSIASVDDWRLFEPIDPVRSRYFRRARRVGRRPARRARLRHARHHDGLQPARGGDVRGARPGAVSRTPAGAPGRHPRGAGHHCREPGGPHARRHRRRRRRRLLRAPGLLPRRS